MNQAKLLGIVFGLLLVQFNGINTLKCKSGYGISPPNSEVVQYYLDNTTPQPDCDIITSTNPYLNNYGCYKNVYRLSGGNLYVELGCFPRTGLISSPKLAGTPNYDSKVFQYVCTTDNCNSSINLKMSILTMSTLIFVSIAKFF